MQTIFAIAKSIDELIEDLADPDLGQSFWDDEVECWKYLTTFSKEYKIIKIQLEELPSEIVKNLSPILKK
jgi:hypothetical protein